MVRVELSKKDTFYIGIFVVLVGVGLVYAYGGSDPSVMGHSSGELQVYWDDIQGIPAGFADGTDDGGSSGGCPSGYSWYYEGSQAICLKEWSSSCSCSDGGGLPDVSATFQARFVNGVAQSRITSCSFSTKAQSASCSTSWKTGSVSCNDAYKLVRVSCSLPAADPKNNAKSGSATGTSISPSASYTCSCTYK